LLEKPIGKALALKQSKLALSGQNLDDPLATKRTAGRPGLEKIPGQGMTPVPRV